MLFIIVLLLLILIISYQFKTDKHHSLILMISLMVSLVSASLLFILGEGILYNIFIYAYFLATLELMFLWPYMFFWVMHKKIQSFGKSLKYSYIAFFMLCLTDSFAIYYLAAPKVNWDAIIWVIFIIIWIWTIFLLNVILLTLIEKFIIKKSKIENF